MTTAPTAAPGRSPLRAWVRALATFVPAMFVAACFSVLTQESTWRAALWHFGILAVGLSLADPTSEVLRRKGFRSLSAWAIGLAVALVAILLLYLATKSAWR
jgi:hypothetical protein